MTAQNQGTSTVQTLAFDPNALGRILGPAKEKQRAFLQKFLLSAAAIIAELKRGQTEDSLGAVAAAAHKLKSSARAVGANALAESCEQLEAASKVEDWQAIHVRMAELDPALEVVAAQLRQA